MKKYSFSISELTPDTLSALRLAEYLKVLTDLIGKKYTEKLHLYEIREGSAEPVFAIEDDIETDFLKELHLINSGDLPANKKKALHNLNQLLREDKSTGGFLVTETKSRIINFPGVQQEEPVSELRTTSLMPITLKGTLYKVGGVEPTIPFGVSIAGENFIGNIRSQKLAKDMAKYLYETIEISGVGHWVVDQDSIKRKLKDFVANEFRPLEKELLFDDALQVLTQHPDNGWAKLQDPLDAALKLRDE